MTLNENAPSPAALRRELADCQASAAAADRIARAAVAASDRAQALLQEASEEVQRLSDRRAAAQKAITQAHAQAVAQALRSGAPVSMAPTEPVSPDLIVA